MYPTWTSYILSSFFSFGKKKKKKKMGVGAPDLMPFFWKGIFHISNELKLDGMFYQAKYIRKGIKFTIPTFKHWVFSISQMG